MTAKLPIRWRLTIWYSTFLALALLLFGAAIYLAVNHEIYDSFKEELNNRVIAAKAAVSLDSSEPSLSESAITNFHDDEHFVRLLSPDGQVLVDTSADVGVAPSDPALISAVISGNKRLAKVHSTEGRFWVISTPVYQGDAVAAVLEVGSSSEDEDDLMRVLLIALLIAAPIVLAAASFGGYALAGRALKPVAAITNLARSVTGDDLDARLGLDLPDDELGRLARTFDEMLARIEDSFERQRRFTGDAAHELRTPLTLIRSQVDIALARTRSAEEYRDALVAIDEDIDRLTRLVIALLTLARSDAGKLAIEREPFRVDETIQIVLSQNLLQAQSAQIELVDDSTPGSVLGDEDMIFQVLNNLLDNAVAHTVESGRIVVGNRIEGESMRIWVEDNGSGIPENQIDRVFDRFYRVDTGRTRRDGGMGLGLAISKAIVEAHRGTIQLTSSVGKGTRIEIHLPAIE